MEDRGQGLGGDQINDYPDATGCISAYAIEDVSRHDGGARNATVRKALQDVLKIVRIEKSALTPRPLWGARKVNDQRVAAAQNSMNVGN